MVVAYAVRHPETPLHLKAAGMLFILYLLSPVDLIPVTVPILGVMDDLILVPWGLSQVVGRLPDAPRADAEERARRFISRYLKRPLLFLAILVGALLIVWAILLWLLFRIL